MSINLSTTRMRVSTVNSIINYFANSLQNNMYFFVGDSLPHSNNMLQDVPTDVDGCYTLPYQNMIMGKQLIQNSFISCIANYPYVSNTVFAMYDNQDQNLFNGEIFYTIVNAGSFYHVFKCLDNNNGSPSTVQPDYTQIVGANTVLYQTSDGYRWKYMCSVDSNIVNAAGTSVYFPLTPNTVVSNAAVPGSIDICLVEFGGKLYNNWILGSFATSDIAIAGDPTIFNCSNNIVSTTNGYYSNCILYLTSGPGIGQFSIINTSFSNNTGTYFKLNNAFTIQPTNGTTYQLYPQCIIQGTGREPQQVIARALVNATASNSIYRIEILQRGIGFANTLGAFVYANTTVGVTSNAVIRPILPPPGGHGSSQQVELNATTLMIYTSLNSSEGNTLITTNQYQQIGLLVNPIFSNSHLTMAFVTSTFLAGETGYLVNPVQIQAQCTIQSGNNFLSTNNGSFSTQFGANSPVLLVSNNATTAQLAFVNNVVNANFLFLQSNVNFSCTSVIAYNPNIYGNVVISTVNSLTDIYVTNCPATMFAGSFLFGVTSGSYGFIGQIQRNDVTKGLNTFIQLYKYSVTIVSGSFIQNEEVMQGNTSGFYHSGNTGTIYLSGVNGVVFLSGQNLVGQQSGAMAQITKIYPQELIFGSGEVFYVENINPITRQQNQQESFRLAFSF